MSNEGHGDFHGCWASEWSTTMIVRLGGLIVRKGCGEFRPVRAGEAIWPVCEAAPVEDGEIDLTFMRLPWGSRPFRFADPIRLYMAAAGLHLRTQAVESTAHIGHAGGQPYLRSGAKFDHLRILSRIVLSNDGSAPRSTLIMALPGNSM